MKPAAVQSLAYLREVEPEIRLMFIQHLNLINESLMPLRQNELYPRAVREFQISPKVRLIISSVHNSIIGHHGVERTFEKLL